MPPQKVVQATPREDFQQLLGEQLALIVPALPQLPWVQRDRNEHRIARKILKSRGHSSELANIAQGPKPVVVLEGIDQLPQRTAKQGDRPALPKFRLQMLAVHAMRSRLRLAKKREAARQALGILDPLQARLAIPAHARKARFDHRLATPGALAGKCGLQNRRQRTSEDTGKLQNEKRASRKKQEARREINQS